MRVIGKLIIDLSGLKKFRRVVAQDLRNSSNGPIRAAMKQWASRYRGFIQSRFIRYSRGGGDWPALKQKRKRGALAKVAILRDTGTLLTALDPTFSRKPGALEKNESFGIRVGYGGPGAHPKAPFTVATLAEIHHLGLGRMPKRTLIVPPSQSVLKGMAGDMQRAMTRLGKGTIG